MNQEFERAMAFAGILQAIMQVQALARDGEVETESLASCLRSVLVTNPETPKEVYGEQPDLNLGYQAILNQLGDGNKKDVEVTRYLVGILALERKLSHNDSALGMLAERFTQVQRQLHHYEITDEQVIANFASIYSDVISPMGHKIQISGNPLHLQRPIVQQKIRALLLSAMRSAVLWRQLGGKRRHLVFSRKAIVDVAKQSLTL